MATDGVEIIDGDLAHSTYNKIMDLYDKGVETSIILNKFPFLIDQDEDLDLEDEFEDEVYFTTIGLAYWEIGILTKDQIIFIEKIIERQAGIRFFGAEDEDEGIARKLVLEQYIKKIKSENKELRSRVIDLEIDEAIFKKNDLIVYATESNQKRLLICCEINQIKGKCSYSMLPTNYLEREHPNKEDLKKVNLWTSQTEEMLFIKPMHSSSKIRLLTISVSHDVIESNKDRFEIIDHLDLANHRIFIGEVWGITNLKEIETSIQHIQNDKFSKKYSLVPLSEIIKK